MSQTQKAFNLWFNDRDLVCAASHTAGSKKPIAESYLPASKHLLTKNYICINPLIDADMGRVTANVDKIQNFMFESDNLDVGEQRKAWEKASRNLPVRSLIYSGSASIHAVFSLTEPLPPRSNDFKRFREAILNKIYLNAPELEGKIDNLSDMVRYTRADGVMRLDTKTQQELLYTGSLLPTEDLKSWTPASKEQPKVIIQSGNFKSIKDLMNYLKLNIPTLYTFYHYAGIWAASAGVYPIIFKNTLWLLEEAKCPVDIAKELYDTKCVPRLVEVGYPNDKLYKPFEHAINYYLGKEG